MAKEAYYFPHDSNAIQDPKMMTLLFECGLMGIGAFWVLIEILHQQPTGSIKQEDIKRYIEFYGKQGAWDADMLGKCERVLIETGLILVKDGMATSNRVKLNLKNRKELTIKKKEAAFKRWSSNAGAMQVHTTSNADAMPLKERKGKEIKEKTKTGKAAFERPSLEEITSYLKDRHSAISPEAFFAFYESKGWRVGDQPMKSWKAAIVTWEMRRRQVDSQNGQAVNSQVVG